jgi:hypothetical protein
MLNAFQHPMLVRTAAQSAARQPERPELVESGRYLLQSARQQVSVMDEVTNPERFRKGRVHSRLVRPDNEGVSAVAEPGQDSA